MLILIGVLTFITVCLLTIGIAIKGERALVRDRVEALRLMLDEDKEMIAPELTLPFGERVVRPWLGRIATAFSKLLPANMSASVAKRLVRAGNPWNLKPAEFIGLKAISIILFTGGAVAYALLGLSELTYQMLILVIGVFIGYTLPDSLLDSVTRERQRVIRKSLADCLDLLVVSVEAGLGLDGAMAKVVEKMRGPLSDEFNKVLQDMSIGRSRMEALKTMAERINLADVTTFVAAVNQSDMLGVSIAHVLRVQSESLRVQRGLRAREAAAKLPVKMLFPLILFIFPGIFIVLLGPAAIKIFDALNTVVR